MKIGELALLTGVTKDSIRHYVSLGLLKPGRNRENGYQIFNELALSRLKFIKTARQLGFHLADIQQIFMDAENEHSPCPRVRELMARRLVETRKNIAQLTSLCNRMEEAIAEWDAMPDSTPTGCSVCRLIESQSGQ